jgi:hypothetical protein
LRVCGSDRGFCNNVAETVHTVLIEADLPDWERRLSEFHRIAAIAHYRQGLEWHRRESPERRGFFCVTIDEAGDIVASSLVTRTRNALGMRKLFIDKGPCLADAHTFKPHMLQLLPLLGPKGDWLRVGPYALGDDNATLSNALAEMGFQRTAGTSDDYLATLQIDLTVSRSQLWANLRPAVRRQIRRRRDWRLRLQFKPSQKALSEFLDSMPAFAVRKGFGYPGKRQASDFAHAAFGQGRSGVLGYASYDGRLVAGIACVPSGRSLLYLWGFSERRPELKNATLTAGLHWGAMLHAKRRGFRHYDLGGYWIGEGSGASVNQFKLGFSSNVRFVLPEYFLPLTPVRGRLSEYLAAGQRLARGFLE